VIGRNELVLGFQLAGLEGVRVKDVGEAVDLLREELRKKERKVIIIDETLLQKAPSYTRQAARQSLVPMVLAIPMEPSEDLAGAQAEYVQNLVREAVGFSVKI